MSRRCGENTHWVQLAQGNDCVTSVIKWNCWQNETGVLIRFLETFSEQNRIIADRSIHAKIYWSVGVQPSFGVGTVWRGDHAGDGWNCLPALGETQGRRQAWLQREVSQLGGTGQAQGLPLPKRLGVRTPVGVSTVPIVHGGRADEGGRCGGNPPAQLQWSVISGQ